MSPHPANARFGLRLSILPKKIAYTKHRSWGEQSAMGSCGLEAIGAIYNSPVGGGTDIPILLCRSEIAVLEQPTTFRLSLL